MKISFAHNGVTDFKADMISMGMFEGEKPEKNLDKKLNNEISGLISQKKFSPEFKQATLITSLGNIPAKQVLLIGLGNKKEFSQEKLRRVSGLAAKIARNSGAKIYATNLHTADFNLKKTEKAKAVAEGTFLGLYDFSRYKTIEKEKIKKIDTFVMLKSDEEIKKIVQLTYDICESVNYVRDMVNTPAKEMTPLVFAKEAQKIAKENKLKIIILGKKEMEKKGMGCILGVARGSSEEPKLVIMEYLGGTKGNPKGKKKIAVVGKGITFDSGGINLKPTGYIENMKDDKAGAAVVLGLMKILPKLGVKHHVIGVMPLTENMPGQSAQKPGDILTAYNKKTIEVVNTDAEGRLILADALSYVEKNYKPDAIIDLATLTGACIVALGYFAAGMLGTDEALIKKITLTGEKTGERVWELPFWDDYRELVKGDIADVNNSIKGAKYTPGTITGAAFISNFVEKTPWVHLDIAGPAWLESDSDYVPRGGTGYGVRLLSQLLVDWN